MTPADVRLTAQLVVGKRVHCVSDEAVEALARRVLELEARETALAQSLEQMTAALDVALDAVRAVGVTVERREDGTGWAVTNTRAVEAETVEREACAKLFFDMASTGDVSLDEMVRTIRARGAR